MKRILTVAILLSGVAGFARAAETKAWKDEAQFSFLNANGNTKSTTLGANNLFTWTKGRATLELPAGALNTKSKGERTAEQYFAGEKFQVRVDARNYVFEKFQWERNTFAGFAHRYDGSVGLGREWMKTATQSFLTELGGGYINEQRLDGARAKFGSGRGYGKYEKVLSATAKFAQDAEYLRNFKEARDWRLTTDTALITSISTNLSLKVGYNWKHRNLPPAGFGKNDTLSSVSLIVNY
jgi:putative salt-induced outer membrane protein YdiY